jgi:NDP-sugar pyrophosphorylase family protein
MVWVMIMDTNDYKVCILAAGKGSRLENFTHHLNKAFLPIRGKPVLSYIIESYDPNVEIVFALGYKSEEMEAFISTAYPDRKFVFVIVDNYDKPGSGPGYSLLCCKDNLQCPFVLANVDALIKGKIPMPYRNWFGVAEVDDTTRFCSVKIDDNDRIVRIDDKRHTDNIYAFTGIAGIYDYETFWDGLIKNKELISGELQVSNGFQELMKKGIYIERLNWYDTGTVKTYADTLKNY